MGIRKYKPTTPGRRGASGSDFSEITRSEPEKSLVRPLHSKGGRNVHGRVTARHQGGHDAAVLVDLAAANQQVAPHQEHRGERIQRGIDGRQQGNHEGSLCSWRMSWRSFLGKPSSLER